MYGNIDNLSVDDVKRISEEVIRAELNDYYLVKEELRALKAGEIVMLPVSKEHAGYMLKVAMSYLGVDIQQELEIRSKNG